MLAVLTVLITAVGLAEILVLRHVLYQRSAQELRNELRLLGSAALTPVSNTTSGLTGSCPGLGSTIPAGAPPPGAKANGTNHAATPAGPAGAAAVAESLAAKSIASAIAGPDGAVLACAAAGRNGHETGFTVPATLPAALSAATGYVTLHAAGHHLLAIRQPVGADTAILVTDLSDDDAAVRVVLTVTVLGGIAALGAAGALSGPLLRAGLAPLRKIATTADAIAKGDLDQRAHLQHSADEVGQLGAAFDKMLDQLQSALLERDTVVEELRTHDRAMRRFVADASHELRTPLTAIRGGAQVLRLGALHDPADLAETLGHIQTQTERMSRLVDDLLLLSRLEAGQPSSQHEVIDLGALVARQGEHWQSIAGDHTVVIQAEPAWVSADSDGLSRVCANLIENAAKHSPPNTTITIRTTRTTTTAELSVTDRGPGIPPGQRQKVFERFYRGDPARARATGGTGLGLAIVASIITDHHGKITIDDNPGGGTNIIVNLPLTPERR
jgi:two-component system OmpR family sensor kinase